MRAFYRRLLIVGLVLFSFWHSLPSGVYGGDVNTLNVAVYKSSIATLDPHVVSSTEKCINYMTYESLVSRFRDTIEIRPKLATAWNISKDARVFTFNLRKGVTFHDGTPFNAEAVKFNFNRITTLKKGFYWMLANAKLEKVEVVDEFTIRFGLKESFAPFISTIEYFPMVSPKSVIDHEEKAGDFAEKWYLNHGVGTGPYRFTEFQSNVKIVHEKYDKYWGGWEGKHCSKVVNWIIPESGTQRMMLEKGDLDIIQNFTLDDFATYKKTQKYVALERDSMALQMIRLNNAAPPTNNLKVRQALSYCFDRKLYEKMVGGRIELPDGPCPKELLDDWRPKNVITEFNTEKAKRMLAEAGYRNGFEISVIAQEGPTAKIIGEVWQDGLTKAGVKLTIRNLPWAAMLTKLNKWAVDRNPSTADHGVIFFLSPRFSDPAAFLLIAYHTNAQTGQGRNWMLYSNPKVDELTEKAIKIVDKKRGRGHTKRHFKWWQTIVRTYT